MDPILQTQMAQLGADLTAYAVKGTVTAVRTKVKSLKNERDLDKLKNNYDEIISELIEEREGIIRIAQTYRAELEKIEISDEDIEHLHNTIETVIDILSSFIDDEGIESFRAIKGIVNVDTLKTMQLLGFSYKDAIGVPLTKLCAKAIENLGNKKNYNKAANKGKK